MSFDAEQPVSLAELEAAFNHEISTNKRAAAETAYALACRCRCEYIAADRPQAELARGWAQRSIELLDSLPSDTVEQIASTRQSVGGIPLPDLLHSDVVRDRLADLLQTWLSTHSERPARLCQGSAVHALSRRSRYWWTGSKNPYGTYSLS
jgi:hypothetical protein